MNAGGRFFWVGRHTRPSDSADSSTSTSLLGRGLVSQNSAKKLPTHAVSACATQMLDQQLSPQSGECLGLSPGGASLGYTEAPHWSLVEGSQFNSLGQASEAEAPTASLQPPRARLGSTPGFKDASMSTEDVDTWTNECSQQDVDHLLDWATDPSLSKPEIDSSAFSMCGSPDTIYNLQLPSSPGMQALGGTLSCSPDAGYSLEPPSPQGMQGFDSSHSCSPNASYSLQLAATQGMQGGLDRQLSCSWDTEASHLDTQCCFQDTNQHAESYSEGLLACALLPGLEAFGEVACQQLSACSELLPAHSSGHGSELSGDPLDQLMESACCPAPEETGQQSSPASTLHGRGCSLAFHIDQETGSFEDRQGPQKKRCGRPRVYDLDIPVVAGIASNAVAVYDYLRGSVPHIMVAFR